MVGPRVRLIMRVLTILVAGGTVLLTLASLWYFGGFRFLAVDRARVPVTSLPGFATHEQLAARLVPAEETQWKGRELLAPDGTGSLRVHRRLGRFLETFCIDELPRGLERGLITVGEMDPGSGSALGVGWTRDSRFVVFTGWGRLEDDIPRRICFVYERATDRLYELLPGICGE